jgi:hypothetical protein
VGTSRCESTSSGTDACCGPIVAQTSAEAYVEPSSRPGDNNEMSGLDARRWTLRRPRPAYRYVERPLPVFNRTW